VEERWQRWREQWKRQSPRGFVPGVNEGAQAFTRLNLVRVCLTIVLATLAVARAATTKSTATTEVALRLPAADTRLGIQGRNRLLARYWPAPAGQ